MRKKSKPKGKIKVADLNAKNANPKGGTDCEGYAYLGSELLTSTPRTTSPTSTTELKSNKN